jgi:hypothetical protein
MPSTRRWSLMVMLPSSLEVAHLAASGIDISDVNGEERYFWQHVPPDADAAT